MRTVLITFFILFSFSSFSKKDSLTYEEAYNQIGFMLNDSIPSDFKKAVFITESAYYNNLLNWDVFVEEIDNIKLRVQLFSEMNEGNFLYNESDKDQILLHGSLFKVLTDTFPFIATRDTVYYNFPYKYDFDDVFGQQNWPNMFVSKLMETRKGNCHSMSYLYKILADDLGINAYISLAPLHMYIKVKSKKLGMYNTELTNVSFPQDAWIMSSGFIHTDAIRNSLYMDTLSSKETIAICLFDLAKGYERKFGFGDGEFMLKCCNKTLEYFPSHVSSLLLKSKILLHQRVVIENLETSKILVDKEYLGIISKIHRLGYRRMPKEMYLRWIGSEVLINTDLQLLEK